MNAGAGLVLPAGYLESRQRFLELGACAGGQARSFFHARQVDSEDNGAARFDQVMRQLEQGLSP